MKAPTSPRRLWSPSAGRSAAFAFRARVPLGGQPRHSSKILTLAPERLTARRTRDLADGRTSPRKIALSLGHSRATEEQAEPPSNRVFGRHSRLERPAVSPTCTRGPGSRPGPSGRLRRADPRPGPRLSHGRALDPEASSRPIALLHLGLRTRCGRPRRGWRTFGNLRSPAHRGACRLARGALAGGGSTAARRPLPLGTSGGRRRASRPPSRLLRRELPSLLRSAVFKRAWR